MEVEEVYARFRDIKHGIRSRKPSTSIHFGEHKSGREGSSVTVDPSRALGGRFITAAKMENCSNYLMFAVSDDGKRWEDRATWYGGDPGADNQPTLLYDPARKDWCVRMRVHGCPSVCWP